MSMLAMLLCLLRRPLGCFQRIDGGCTGKSTALPRRLLGFGDHQIPAVRSRHAALHHQQVLVLIHATHSQVAGGHACVSHVSRHAHAFENTRWKCRRTNRASNLKHGTVRLRPAAKMVTLDYALKPTSFAHAYNVNEPFAIENVHQHAVTRLDGRSEERRVGKECSSRWA